jgi:hypothetical protein
MTTNSTDQNEATGARREPPTIDLEASEVTDATAPGADPQPATSPAASRAGLVAPAVSGAVAALAVALAAGGLAWSTGMMRPQAPPPAPAAAPSVSPAQLAGVSKDVTELGARLAKLESAAARPAPAPAPAPDPTLAARLSESEKAIDALRADIAALRSDLAALPAAPQAMLRETPPPAPPPPDLAPLQARLAQLEQAASAKAAEPPAVRGPSPAEQATRRTIVASALESAVRRGEPFTALLASARQIAPDGAALTPLEPFAARGVPSDAALGQELLAALPRPAAAKPAPPPETPAPQGVLDRLQAGAAKLVRIERAGEPAQTPAPATSSYAAIAAAAGKPDIAAARREIERLAAADRAPLDPWLRALAARDAALSAAQKFSADALAALAAVKD